MFQEIDGSAPNPGHYNEQLNQHAHHVCMFIEYSDMLIMGHQGFVEQYPARRSKKRGEKETTARQRVRNHCRRSVNKPGLSVV